MIIIRTLVIYCSNGDIIMTACSENAPEYTGVTGEYFDIEEGKIVTHIDPATKELTLESRIKNEYEQQIEEMQQTINELQAQLGQGG